MQGPIQLISKQTLNDLPINKMSPKLQKMVDEMNKNLKPHVNVFPKAPRPEEIAIPTGGLATCLCSPNCTVKLPQPAYHIIGRSKDDERYLLDQEQDTFYLPLIGRNANGDTIEMNLKMKLKSGRSKK